jgi:colicin import membrane protein
MALDVDRIRVLLEIVKEAAGHPTKLKSVGALAMRELEAKDAEAKKEHDELLKKDAAEAAAAKAKADAEAKKIVEAEAKAAADAKARDEQAKKAAADKAAVDAKSESILKEDEATKRREPTNA